MKVYCCCWFFVKPKCEFCHSNIQQNINSSFCDEKCETLYLYQDSFKFSDSSQYRFILDI
jgi:hypothetical protein